MDTVRMGVIGIGGMGGHHARSLRDGKIRGATLSAVCDVEIRHFAGYPQATPFTDHRELYASGAIDAVVIATPHYAHAPLTVAAFEANLHVLTEKPMAVHKLDCETMIAACRPNLHFGIMFQQRLSPVMRKLKDLVGSGELGRITRVNWIVTDWFRTDRYYAGGGWRGTWAGEGGGVLMNQCPHNLDLLQWICGMPVRVHAHVGLGKWHKDIEVEDEVTACLEYANGATGVFITTTAEAPGVNRFEVCGENGQLVAENGELRYRRNRVSALEFLRTSEQRFASPEVWEIRVPLDSGGEGHDGITQNFVDAILKGVPLVAPGVEGIRQVELGSAMLQSGLTGKTVELPLDGRAFKRLLQRLVRDSKGKPRAGS